MKFRIIINSNGWQFKKPIVKKFEYLHIGYVKKFGWY